jgi:hypothetical protein
MPDSYLQSFEGILSTLSYDGEPPSCSSLDVFMFE